MLLRAVRDEFLRSERQHEESQHYRSHGILRNAFPTARRRPALLRPKWIAEVLRRYALVVGHLFIGKAEVVTDFVDNGVANLREDLLARASRAANRTLIDRDAIGQNRRVRSSQRERDAAVQSQQFQTGLVLRCSSKLGSSSISIATFESARESAAEWKRLPR